MKRSITITAASGVVLRIEASGEAITKVEFAAAGEGARETPPDELLARTALQLAEYFAGSRRAFDLPSCPGGTEFQRRVWAAVSAIPYGETRSYAGIARAIGCPKAVRAVGAANGANPLPILIPCHRVVASGGGLGGYGGGLAMKRRLLDLESGARQGGSDDFQQARLVFDLDADL
jgi:methylated-DNA-[protein]-cysteine S-methyltransferase